MNLKENRKGNMGEFGGRKGKGGNIVIKLESQK